MLTTSGLFSPNLRPLCKKYDDNLDTYHNKLAEQASLSERLQQHADTLNIYKTAVEKNKGERDNVHTQNVTAVTENVAKITAFKKQEENADIAQVVAALDAYQKASNEILKMDKAFADKREELGAKLLTDLKKISDSYGKESKVIKTALDNLEKAENDLAGQIGALVLRFQQIVVAKSQKPSLATDLGQLLGVLT